MPKISVIMGVYNSKNEKVLSRAIESILNQSFSDFEFIICDDCSTKKFIRPLLVQYKEIDNRIKILENKENLGLAASLNKCIELSEGQYIARQDDDDISIENRLEIEQRFLDENENVSVVSCNLLLLDEDKIWGKQILKEKPEKVDLMFGTTFAHPALMIRKQALALVGNYSSEKITRRTEDYDLYFKLASKDLLGVNIQEFLFLYYQGTDTYKKQKIRYRIDEFRLRKKWFGILGLYPKGFIYLFKPIISGLCPMKMKVRKKIDKYELNKEESKYYNQKYHKYLILGENNGILFTNNNRDYMY